MDFAGAAGRLALVLHAADLSEEYLDGFGKLVGSQRQSPLVLQRTGAEFAPGIDVDGIGAAAAAIKLVCVWHEQVARAVAAFLLHISWRLISLQCHDVFGSDSIGERRQIAVEAWRERGRESELLPERFHELFDGRHLAPIPIHGFRFQRELQAAVFQHLHAADEGTERSRDLGEPVERLFRHRVAGDIDGEGRHLLQSLYGGFREEGAVGVELEQKAFANCGLIDLKEMGMHENIAACEIEPHDAQLLHVIEQAMDFFERQFARKEVLAVVGVGVAMAAMEVATIGQLQLGLDHGSGGRSLRVNSLAECTILNGWDGSLVRHDASLVG